ADDLGQRLDLEVPDGYVVQPEERDDTGPSDLEKAISDDGGDDAREVFTRDRFVRGYQREWALDDDDTIVSYVYQFADQAGAEDYTKRVTADAGSPGDGVTAATFDVPEIAGAVGVTGSDGTFSTATVTFAKGPYSVQLLVTSTKPDGLESLVTSLAGEQYSKL
ncbi:MAG TPA: hypothetical protein VHL53_12050, partial [Acidimicrobiia bacterium]|nr:hypothetical protein [Acidimicrobiia bacterium]